MVVITATVTAAYALSGDPTLFYFYALMQFAAGAVVHNRSWLIVIMIVTSLNAESYTRRLNLERIDLSGQILRDRVLPRANLRDWDRRLCRLTWRLYL